MTNRAASVSTLHPVADSLRHRRQGIDDPEVARAQQIDGSVIRRCGEEISTPAKRTDSVVCDVGSVDALSREIDPDQTAPVVADNDHCRLDKADRLGRTASQSQGV